jgi:hypothetical protein
MSGPNDIQGMMKSLGLPGVGGKGPLPTMPIGQTKKRLGDERVPMSSERPTRNPGQIQDQAARQLGVRPEQVQPSAVQRPPPRNIPPQAPVQAPPPPTLPKANVPMPTPRPNFDPEVNPRTSGGIPMPQERPIGADVGSMLGALSGAGGGPPPAMIAKVLGDRVAAANGPPQPPSSFGNSLFNLLGGGGGDAAPQTKPGLSSAVAAPAPTAPPSDPFSAGAPPVQAGPQQLMQVMAAAAKAKDAQRPPVQDPTATQPSPNVTPPVPRGVAPPPPPAMAEPETLTPAQPQFKGYEVRPAKPAKGEEGRGREKALKKENNPYYYTRIGVRPGDNAGVAQRLREVRAKAENPRTARTMTPEEDRILAQYNEKDSYLMSMLPADVAARMQQYKSGQLTGQIPDRYQERPPGVEPGSGAPTPLKLPPKSSQTKAEKLANDAIQNPPKRNATDADPTTDEETPPEKSSSQYSVKDD